MDEQREPNYHKTFAELQDRLATARAAGYDVIQSTSETLLLDLDTPAAVAAYNRAIVVALEVLIVQGVEWWNSKSGHVHVHVRVKPGKRTESFRDRLMWQAILGSDGVREQLSYRDWASGTPWLCEEPSYLFRPGNAAVCELDAATSWQLPEGAYRG